MKHNTKPCPTSPLQTSPEGLPVVHALFVHAMMDLFVATVNLAKLHLYMHYNIFIAYNSPQYMHSLQNTCNAKKARLHEWQPKSTITITLINLTTHFESAPSAILSFTFISLSNSSYSFPARRTSKYGE